MEWSWPDLKCRLGSELIAVDYRRGEAPQTKQKQGNAHSSGCRGLPNTASVASPAHIWTIYAFSYLFVSATQEG